MINNIYLFVILLMPWIITAGCLIVAGLTTNDSLRDNLGMCAFVFFLCAMFMSCFLS